ncbi:MAG: efflux RND transporter periplasmic adaptor subunit [Candidatus Melainabacteria bacterium]|nr:MAG: efflux RND transporter periplasmic adaptor subunit [Candidatus Melainabacteria bacterium]
MNKKLKVAIILAICIILTMLLVFVGKKKSIKYQTAIVEKGTVMEKVEATGTIKPVQTVEIGAQVSGMIKEVYVDYNSHVKKGQLLAQIDTSLFQAQVDQAQATLAVKQANYKKYRNQTAYKKATYVRYQKLYNQGYVSKDSLESAKTDYNVNLAETASTRADIQQASATLRNNLANLRYCRIVSPVDGVVISKNVEVGQTVASSFQTPTLFEVAQDLTKMRIEASVSEADIGKVKQGQEVDYTLDGYPDKVFKGVVSQVRLASTTTNNVVTYTVVVDVNNPDGILIPGMTANIEIITNKKENILTVPHAALKFVPQNHKEKYEKQGVWVLRKRKPVRVSIETGISDDFVTEVSSSELQEGDVVILKIEGKDKKSGSPRPPM